MADTVFNSLYEVNVSGHTEKKKSGGVDLTYLSWPYAWAEVKKRFPDASYEIVKDEKGLPYVYDELTGYMVYTKVTIDGITHEMWLPVMDGANKAMKSLPYTYKVKEYANGRWTGGYTDKIVEAATMFDINKTIMRCLVKNLAMFGLGLYIYAGEDLPITEEYESAKTEDKKEQEKAEQQFEDVGKMKIAPLKVDILKKKCSEENVPEDRILKLYKLKSVEDMTEKQFQNCMQYWEKVKSNA